MLARKGAIFVNGKPMECLHYQVRPFKDKITFKGKLIQFKENRRYFVLNKPLGFETTKENLLNFLRGKVPSKDFYSFYPVGRLDKDSTGLIILTNDGRAGKKILDPKTKREKIYEVKVDGLLTQEKIKKLCEGVWIDIDETKYKTLPAKIHVLSTSDKKSLFELKIIEGKKRQIRKMCNAVGLNVTKLVRVQIAKLALGKLKEGQIKEYTKKEFYSAVFE